MAAPKGKQSANYRHALNFMMNFWQDVLTNDSNEEEQEEDSRLSEWRWTTRFIGLLFTT